MNSRNPIRGSHLRRSALVVALGLCMTSGAAYAQSRSAGAIFGNAEAGSQVVATSTETGLSRSVTVGADGRYQMVEMPVGAYKVSIVENGETVSSRNVTVSVGAVEVDFGAAANAEELSGVTVSANMLPSIDVRATDSKITLTAATLNKVPVARDITQAAVLAPSVIPADSRYGNSVSFGGSAASENAYFINGYPVTNALTNIGSTSLPFDAIRSEQVITGGYGPRYGRSTGGVINIVTKSGTNEWKAGAEMVWEPEALRASRRWIYYPTNTGASSDGSVYRPKSSYSSNPFTYGVYLGGPLIKDRLFIYATGEWHKNNDSYNQAVNANPNTAYIVDDVRRPRWLAKIDWNINDNNILEVTAISDKTNTTRSRYAYNFDDYSTAGSEKTGGYTYKDGGEVYIGKYTGYWTDNLTVSALYGQQKVTHYSAPWGYDPSAVAVSDNRPAHAADPVVGLQPYTTLPDPKAYDQTDGYRLDVNWRLGDHNLSFGYDVLNSESRAGVAMSGPGYSWIYYHTDDGITEQGGFKTAPNSDYVDKYIYENGGTFRVEQEAYYIQDTWQVSDRWMLKLGLRNDKFTNYNSDGIAYVSQDNQWAPRLGFSWDVNGDSSLKIYGSAGRYFLAMPLNVAVRGASGSTYTEQYFTFTGIDPTTGVPLGTIPINDTPYSANNEYGQAPDPRTVAAKGLKSHYQDEYILGMEQKIGSSWTWGARLQYRDLKSAIDDQCDNRPMLKYMQENNIPIDPNYSWGPDCRLFNPGEDNVMLLDIPDAAGSPELVPVPYSAEDMGVYLKRKYIGLDVFLEHPFDGKWYGRVEYTLSHNWGNDEGQLDSDIGQGDVSQTVLFDHHELMAYGGGDLPNDRRHVLKAYGYYSLTPEWRVGGVLVARTGRPKQCLGYFAGEDADAYNPHAPTANPDDGAATTQSGYQFWNEHLNYGPYYHYCDGKAVPRGSLGRLPTDFQLSLNAAYMPSWAPGLTFQVDVLNVLDKQVAQNIREIGELGGQGVEYAQHGRVISYDSPRAFRFTVRYDFSL